MGKYIVSILLVLGLLVKNSVKSQNLTTNKDDCVQKIDLILVLDGSFSVTSQNFELVKDWVKNLVDEMHLERGYIQVGVVQYSYYNKFRPMNRQRYIKTEIKLGQYNNSPAFNRAVDRITYQGYQTYTAHALNKTLNEDFVSARNRYPEAKRVLILLTDGKATDSQELLPVIKRAINEMGVVIYAVGVGRFDERELLLITGNHSDRVFQQRSFDDLSTIEADLQVQLKKSCDCNPLGSETRECDACTKQCSCKPHVEGRRCDRCTPNNYGFGGEEGCIPCRCDLRGATNKTCRVRDGQCYCKRGFGGLNCGSCKKGFYGFPDCRQCECNGFSDDCDQETGVCFDCFYGRSGNHCEKCPAGQFVSIDSIGGCKPCPCNGNIDADNPDACDPLTGRCLRCLHNSAGNNCEKCKDYFYGNALRKSCQQCKCNLTGTDPKSCNESKCKCSDSGYCSCLPNVNGKHCNKCIQGTWNIESGIGCVRCECDAVGSFKNITCDQITGQCSCKNGYSGRSCSECATGFTKLPKSEACVDENTLTTTQAAATTTTTTITTTTASTTAIRRKPIPVNPGWTPCVSCGSRRWPSYCRGWFCRRRWPYYQQHPSPRRCYSWQWTCRASIEYQWNRHQQNYNDVQSYSSWNRPLYYRGYYSHRRFYRYQNSRPLVRYNLYKS